MGLLLLNSSESSAQALEGIVNSVSSIQPAQLLRGFSLTASSISAQSANTAVFTANKPISGFPIGSLSSVQAQSFSKKISLSQYSPIEAISSCSGIVLIKKLFEVSTLNTQSSVSGDILKVKKSLSNDTVNSFSEISAQAFNTRKSFLSLLNSISLVSIASFYSHKELIPATISAQSQLSGIILSAKKPISASSCIAYSAVIGQSLRTVKYLSSGLVSSVSSIDGVISCRQRLEQSSPIAGSSELVLAGITKRSKLLASASCHSSTSGTLRVSFRLSGRALGLSVTASQKIISQKQLSSTIIGTSRTSDSILYRRKSISGSAIAQSQTVEIQLKRKRRTAPEPIQITSGITSQAIFRKRKMIALLSGSSSVSRPILFRARTCKATPIVGKSSLAFTGNIHALKQFLGITSTKAYLLGKLLELGLTKVYWIDFDTVRNIALASFSRPTKTFSDQKFVSIGVQNMSVSISNTSTILIVKERTFK